MKDKFNVEAQNLPEPEEKEMWAPAPGYEDRYEISNFGNIRNKKNQRLRAICYDNNGYPTVSLKLKGKVHCVYIHRLVCEAFNGAPTAEKNICDHIDHCIVNNYYKNLRWTDPSGNGLNRKQQNKHRISLTKTPIVFLDLYGRLVQRFDSIMEAHMVLGVSIQQIQHNLRGNRRPFKNGFFKLEEDYRTQFDS